MLSGSKSWQEEERQGREAPQGTAPWASMHTLLALQATDGQLGSGLLQVQSGLYERF